MKKAQLAIKATELADKISQYEAAYHKIRISTGINDMNQIIEKSLHQKDTLKNLKSMREEAEKNIVRLTNELTLAHDTLAELKFSGLGNLNQQKKIVNSFEGKVSL